MIWDLLLEENREVVEETVSTDEVDLSALSDESIDDLLGDGDIDEEAEDDSTAKSES